MDYRKNMNTPRDMIDDEMLLRLMREAEPVAATFGGNVRRENRRRNNTGNCGCRAAERRDERSSDSRCGCGSDRSSDDRRENRSGDRGDGEYENRNRRSNRSNNRCGCEDESRERRENRSGNRCGCEDENRERREDRSGNRCSCENENRERREDRSDNRCGCENENRERREDRSDNGNCGCGNDERYTEDREGRNTSCESCANDDRMKNFRLAMAYVPRQEWENIYEDEVALSRGTLFEALDLPWYQSACDGGNGTCRKCSDNR